MNNNNNNWKNPEELEEFNFPKFPIKEFPEKLKKYGEAVAEELQVPIDMVGTGLLAILALCNQGKYLIKGKENWYEPLNLYAINIARPSERKSPTMSKIVKPIYEYEKEENEKRKLNVKINKDKKEMYENKIKRLKGDFGKKGKSDNQIKNELIEINTKLLDLEEINFIRLTVDDVTPEALVSVMLQNNEKSGIFSSEGGIFSTMAGRYSNNVANIDILLKAYSGDKVSVDRKGKETETLYNPLLTILLFVQPIIVEELFGNNEFVGKGLCARFLYCYPKSNIGNRKIDSKAVEKELEEEYKNIIKRLLKRTTEQPKIIELSSKAYILSNQFGEYIESCLNNKFKLIEDWAGKFHGTTLRIAANLYLIDNIDNIDDKNLIISEEIMKKAINIGMYYIHQAKRTYKIIETDPDKIQAKRIINILKKKKITGTLKRYDLYKICRGKNINVVEDIDRPLKILEKEGYIRINEQLRAEGAGRNPANMVELNPLFFK